MDFVGREPVGGVSNAPQSVSNAPRSGALKRTLRITFFAALAIISFMTEAACLAPANWYVISDGKPRATRESDVLADMARRDVVLLGEQHDDPDHHQWQLQTLAALHALRPNMVIGFESFPRRLQPVLDQVATEKGLQIVLNANEAGIAWANLGLDISSEIIKKLDAPKAPATPKE